MNIQLLVALQEFVSEVNSVVNSTTPQGFTFGDLDDKATSLDSILHALIESENARLNVLAENGG